MAESPNTEVDLDFTIDSQLMIRDPSEAELPALSADEVNPSPMTSEEFVQGNCVPNLPSQSSNAVPSAEAGADPLTNDEVVHGNFAPNLPNQNPNGGPSLEAGADQSRPSGEAGSIENAAGM